MQKVVGVVGRWWESCKGWRRLAEWCLGPPPVAVGDAHPLAPSRPVVLLDQQCYNAPMEQMWKVGILFAAEHAIRYLTRPTPPLYASLEGLPKSPSLDDLPAMALPSLEELLAGLDLQMPDLLTMPDLQLHPLVQPQPSLPSGPPVVEARVVEPRPDLPTTEETRDELRRRMGKELYRLELDLMGGGRIAGKPCDCLSAKHQLGLEATAEELLAFDQRPVYGQVMTWLVRHSKEFEPANIPSHPPEYYQGLIPEVRAFRKEVMGTEKLAALLTDEEKAELVKKVEEAENG